MDKEIVKTEKIKICPHCKNKMIYVIFDKIDHIWLCEICGYSCCYIV